MIWEWQALKTMSKFNILTASTNKGRRFGYLVVQPTLIERILEAQNKDESLQKWFTKASAKGPENWNICLDGGLM